jgi:hypothetical protein
VHTRLGLNVHRDVWPTAATLSANEGAGFAWVHVHTPPGAIIADRHAARRHARALHGVLDATGLRLLLHAPDDFGAGTSEGDRAFGRRLDNAAVAGAELIAYHGLGHLHITADATRSDLAAHAAPVMLEIETSPRPPLELLAARTARLLDSPAAAAA